MTTRLLTVCSYNRARSVLAEFLLRRALADADVDAVVIGAGFASAGEPPLASTASTLRRMGIDVGNYRSRRVTPELVREADLVLTAERLHVMRIAEDDPGVFERCFTFPEFVAAAEQSGPRAGKPVRAWVAGAAPGRTHATFLSRHAPEVADPAGRSDQMFGATAAELESLSRRLAALL